MTKACTYIAEKPWFNVVCRIMIKAKQLFRTCSNFVPETDWNKIVKILVDSFGNRLFFNQSTFGGNKNTF